MSGGNNFLSTRKGAEVSQNRLSGGKERKALAPEALYREGSSISQLKRFFIFRRWKGN